MGINSYFFNAVESGGVYDRVYNSEDITSYLNLLVGDGVFPNPSTQLQVRASSGMNVVVGAGSGWINGHKMVNTTDMVLSVAASDVLMNRIDSVVFYVDYENRNMGIQVKTGTLAANPVAPELVRTDDRYEMQLATIQVNKKVSAITTAMITDTRMDSDVCGYVQGLIQQVDTSTLWQQQQQMFDDWFNSVKDQFQAGKLFKKYEGVYVTQEAGEASFNVLSLVPHYAFAYDILEVYISGIHLNGNEYTITNNTVNLETPIEEAGVTVTFVVYKSVDQS
ncbi:hypothetical protein [Anaerotignum sp.]